MVLLGDLLSDERRKDNGRKALQGIVIPNKLNLSFKQNRYTFLSSFSLIFLNYTRN